MLRYSKRLAFLHCVISRNQAADQLDHPGVKAKAKGKYKGREPTVAVQAVQIRALHATGEKPARIARRLGVARSSVYRMLEGTLDTSGNLPNTVAAVAAG
jgi:transcriptional regulator of acetoin/glycerol metabolism